MDANVMVQAAQTAGAKYGYDTVEAEIVGYADFKLRWKRSYRWIQFSVSDYLLDIDDADAEPFFDSIFRKINGIPSSYPEGVIRTLTAPEFSQRHAQTFVCRHRTMRNDDGRVKAVYDRLTAKGLTEGEMPTLVISNANTSSPGVSSILMKVIALNEKLFDESEEVQEIALFVLLWHMNHSVFGSSNEHLWDDLSAKMGSGYIEPMLQAGYKF
jgi:hypothetical protein